MSREVKLGELGSVIDGLDYPTTPAEVRRTCADVTLVLADGTEALSDVIDDSNADAFDSPDELGSELMSLLPRHAVGEPYQSEGDA